jgi:putative PIN family toxin of toxin-antitoxin system
MNSVVFDTNTLISALLRPQSIPWHALAAALSHGRALFSESTWSELETVAHRPKFERYVTDAERDEFLEALAGVAARVRILYPITACRDPTDDKFLEVAVNGGASCIVTGDDDLLTLHPFRGIDILNARDFLESRHGAGVGPEGEDNR